jgi:hypothetical protein
MKYDGLNHTIKLHNETIVIVNLEQAVENYNCVTMKNPILKKNTVKSLYPTHFRKLGL